MTSRAARCGLALAAPLMLALAAPAAAHHPLGGMPMETFAHGLLSGAGHPVLGFDHLMFVAAAGIAAALGGRLLAGAGAYVAAMLAGTLAVSLGLVLPGAEAVIALSLLAVGGAVALGRVPRGAGLLLLLGGFGLFHGAAFAGTILGQEGGAGAGVLAGYLLGLGAVQAAIAAGAGLMARAAARVDTLRPRLAGALVAGAGLFLTLEAAEGAVFAALGWG